MVKFDGTSGSVVPGLVNQQFANWKDPPFFNGKITIFNGKITIFNGKTMENHHL